MNPVGDDRCKGCAIVRSVRRTQTTAIRFGLHA